MIDCCCGECEFFEDRSTDKRGAGYCKKYKLPLVAQVWLVLENGEKYDITEYVDWAHPMKSDDEEDEE